MFSSKAADVLESLHLCLMTMVAVIDKSKVARSVTDGCAYRPFHKNSSRQGDIPHVCFLFAMDAREQTL
jgi:hypothetical protein